MSVTAWLHQLASKSAGVNLKAKQFKPSRLPGGIDAMRLRTKDYQPFVSVLFAALGLSGTVMAQGGTLTGTVVDPQGAAVQNVYIELRWNDVGSNSYVKQRPRKKHLATSTNSAGQFSVRLSPGDYDVFAYLDGFAPTCAVVAIFPGETAIVNLRFAQIAPQRLTDRGK
jgi:Carboxypeptidase regulatory-like domain